MNDPNRLKEIYIGMYSSNICKAVFFYKIRFDFDSFFFNLYSGGSNQVPLDTAATNGLLCQPRVIMIMEKSVEWLAGETEVLGENLPQCRFVHHKPHMLPVLEPGPPRWVASV
jgi:hypothetical protein